MGGLAECALEPCAPTQTDCFESAFRFSGIGMALVALDGKFLKVNPALCRITGYTELEMQTLTFQDITHPDDLADDIEHARQLLDGEIASYHMEKRYRHKRGHWLWILLTGSLVRDAAGAPLYYIGQIQDLSESKRAEEEQAALEIRLRQAQKLESLGVMAGGIAHEFNNLLTTLLGYTEVALRRLPADSAAHPCLKEIEVAALRAALLTEKILAYSGGGFQKLRACDVTDCVRAAVPDFKRVLEHRATLTLELADTLPPVAADRGQLQRVLINLVTNAAEAVTEGRGSVRISSGVRMAAPQGAPNRSHQPYVVLSVEDNGCGIPAKHLGRLFDPFFTTKFTGRGLGLAVADGIVRSHRGFMDVTSVPGLGSRFDVLLPVQATGQHSLNV